MRLSLLIVLIMTVYGQVSAHGRTNDIVTEPHIVLAFGIRTENALGAVHDVTDIRQGRLDAIVDCEGNSGGTQCILAMAYPQCGAMAELQLGRALGNPVGWAPDNRESIPLRTAMDRAMRV